ncbi:MAG TPA: universal stress protein [Chloroflexota bacterium]|nr:universal stress protein [Chloroflexota bacterium]
MRIVVAIDERLRETPLARVPPMLRVQGAEVVLVHVLDTGGREEWERAAGRRLLRPGWPRDGGERMRLADRTAGERLLAAAASATEGWDAAHVQTRLLEGSPKHEIRGLLDAEGADVLVVFVHGTDVGPKSIHKEARFLIDHAPCAVLVVKG